MCFMVASFTWKGVWPCLFFASLFAPLYRRTRTQLSWTVRKQKLAGRHRSLGTNCSLLAKTSECRASPLDLPCCTWLRCEVPCSLRHSEKPCLLHKTAGAPSAVQGRSDKPFNVRENAQMVSFRRAQVELQNPVTDSTYVVQIWY